MLTLLIGHAYADDSTPRNKRVFDKFTYTLDALPVHGESAAARDMRSRHFQHDFDDADGILALVGARFGATEVFDRVIFDLATMKFWLNRSALTVLLRILKPGGALYLLDVDAPPGGINPSKGRTIEEILAWVANTTPAERHAYHAEVAANRVQLLKSVFDANPQVLVTYLKRLSDLPRDVQDMVGRVESWGAGQNLVLTVYKRPLGMTAGKVRRHKKRI